MKEVQETERPLKQTSPSTKRETCYGAGTSEGELSIDVYETEESLVVQSFIAGVKAKDLDISIENGVLTIRGGRKKPAENEESKYFYRECFWGLFSRQLILPEEVDASKIEAKVKDGVLTLTIPKIKKKKNQKIVIKDEE